MEQQSKQAQLKRASATSEPRPGEAQVGDSRQRVDLVSADQNAAIGKMEASQLAGAPAVVVKREGMSPVDVAVKQEEVLGSIPGKRRRGRPPRNQAQTLALRAPPVRREEEEEDVCFICFDGGSLVLCDRRGCPKAYHPACIKRDEAFFRSKAKWNCGWHICSGCEKASHYLCYTCTYSVCKRCIKDADYSIVRENNGFCGVCMKTIMLIEHAAQRETVQVDFDDKTSWEYLFKVYWLCLKEKLSLTLDELMKATNPWKTVVSPAPKLEQAIDLRTLKNVQVLCSENSCENVAANHAKRRKNNPQPAFLNNLDSQHASTSVDYQKTLPSEATKWATKELLEFVAHMRNGNTSILSQFDVQALLLEYIKRHNLRDPRQKSQIICDFRLVKLFGRERVGHFEMLSLLESHFLLEENTSATNAIRLGVINPIPYQVQPDGNRNMWTPGSDKTPRTRKKADERGALSNPIPYQVQPDVNHNTQTLGSDKMPRTRKKADEREVLSNPEEYAAINVHNINLVYLRRDLMENLIDDLNNFNEKVVGSIVRIRISDNNQKQDIYRLVQVVGTRKAMEPYKVGTRTTDVMLEILNSDKKEIVSVDGISNQEFTEDECKRFRQSIIRGLNKRLTVGEIRSKAVTLQTVRVNDVLQAEILRLSHLRDRASEKGLRKELRECVEKLELLNSPEERQRRLQEIPDVHTDPSIHPGHASTEHAELGLKQKDNHVRAESTSIVMKEKELETLRDRGDILNDLGSGAQKEVVAAFLRSKNVCTTFCVDKSEPAQAHDKFKESPWNQGRETHGLKSQDIQVGPTGSGWNNQAVVRSEPSAIFSDALSTPHVAHPEEPNNGTETDIIWQYQDPSGRIQGPFSMLQLRKWSTTGHFPPHLRIWRISEKQDCSILLTDAVAGRLHKSAANGILPPQEARLVSSDRNHNPDSGWSAIVRAAQLESKKLDVNLNTMYVDSPADSNCNDGLTGNPVSSKDIPNSTTYAIPAASVPGGDKLQSDDSRGQPQVSCSLSSSMIQGNPGATEVKTHAEVDRWSAGQRDVNGGVIKNMVDLNNDDGCIMEKQDDSDGNTAQSQGQNWNTQPVTTSSSVWDSDAGFVSFTNLLKASKLNLEIDFPDLPSPPKPNPGGLGSQAAETKSSSVLVHSSDLSLSTTSSLMVAEAQFPHVTAQVTHSSAWPAIVADPDECDESVSDLLAEVEAMESMNGLPSPTSNLRGGGDMRQGSENDRFNPLEELSPPRDASKSQTPSSANNLQIPSHSTASDKHIVLSHTGIPSSQKISSGTSSITTESEGNRRPSDASVNQCHRSSNVPPTTTPTTCQSTTATGNISRSGSEARGSPRGAVYNHSSSGWGGPHGSSKSGGSGHYSPRENAGSRAGTASGHRGPFGHQERYGGERVISSQRDRDFQGSGRARPWWSNDNRQPPYAGPNGSGYSRPPPKGQRVCKYYESGYCKKGAACSFWHP